MSPIVYRWSYPLCTSAQAKHASHVISINLLSLQEHLFIYKRGQSYFLHPYGIQLSCIRRRNFFRVSIHTKVSFTSMRYNFSFIPICFPIFQPYIFWKSYTPNLNIETRMRNQIEMEWDQHVNRKRFLDFHDQSLFSTLPIAGVQNQWVEISCRSRRSCMGHIHQHTLSLNLTRLLHLSMLEVPPHGFVSYLILWVWEASWRWDR